jgi:hypothetical protein
MHWLDRKRLRFAGVGPTPAPAPEPEPPPAPAPGDLNVDFGLLSGAGGTDLPFTFGHVFAEGAVASDEYVTATGATEFQAVPTTYWPDGSVRHAIISGLATCTADVEKTLTLSNTTDAPSGTDLTEADLETALTALGTNTLVIGGTQTITLENITETSALHRTVCTGPVMSNFIYRVAVTGHDHLVAWFDMRVYSDGTVYVFPWIENAYFLVASPAADTRTYAFTFNGSLVYNASTTIYHHTRIPLISGRHEGYWSTDPEITPVFDVAYLRNSKMFPNYAQRTFDETTLNALDTTYVPNSLAEIDSSMTSGGTSASIINREQAIFIGCGDVRAWKAGLHHDLSGGSWSTHYRNEAGTTGPDNEPFLFTDYPDASIQQQDDPVVPTGGTTVGVHTNGTPGVSHEPAYGYFGWLLTGTWFFLEELLFWGGWNYLWQDSRRLGADGVIASNSGANTDRGAAWGLRTIAQALVCMPDDHPCYADRKQSWEANMAWYHSIVIEGLGDDENEDLNNLGIFPFYGSFADSVYDEGFGGGSNDDTVMWGASWMQHMISLVLGYTWDLKLPQSGTSETHHEAIRDFGYIHPIAHADDGQGTHWSYRSFGTFATPFGPIGGTYYSSWDDAWAAYKTGFSLTVTTDAGGGETLYQHSSTNALSQGTTTVLYGGMALMALTYAKDHGVTGAAEAYDRVSGASNFDAFEDYEDPVFYTMPRSSELPAWRVDQDVNEWVELAGTAMSNFPPSVDPGRDSGGPAAKMYAWSGFAIDTRNNEIWSLANGGHDDYHGNEVMKFTLGDDSPEWIEVWRSSDGFTVPNDSNYYSDGAPVSSHSYYQQQFIEARDRALRVGAGSGSTIGNPKPVVDGFDCTTSPGNNGWDSSGTYPNTPHTMTGIAIAKNPATEDLYCFFDNASARKWTQTTNTWSSIHNEVLPTTFGEAAAAYDSTRDRVFLFKSYDNNARHTFDVSTGLFTARTLTGAAASSVEASLKGIGMVYVPTLDAYIVRHKASGDAIYKINADTFECTAISTTGGESIPVGATASGENIYNRFLYAPNLGGVVYFPSYSDNAWFLRLH